MSKIVRLSVAALSVLVIGGCATQQPRLTRAQYLATTQRDYTDRTPDQVIAAAERLLQLADGNDFVFAHKPNGFVATRNWTVYVVLAATMGTDTWVLETRPSGGGAIVNLQVGSQAGTVTGMSTGNGGVAPLTTPTVANPVQGTAIYDLFWSRLDYLLGKRPDWMTCARADQRVDQKIVWGDNETLCNSFNIKDVSPRAPMIPYRP